MYQINRTLLEPIACLTVLNASNDSSISEEKIPDSYDKCEPGSKGRFPLGGISRAERHFPCD